MRYEFKYIARISDLEKLRTTILPFVELDKFAEIDDKNQYTVRSIYFDTPRYEFYYDKIEGIKNRKKVRLRGYDKEDGNNIVFFEIKRKYDIPIVKYRAPVKFEDAMDMFRNRNINGQVLSNEHYIKGNENSKRFFFQVFSNNLRPVILIVYEREAYYCKMDNTIRLTLDKNLRSKPYPAIEDLFEENKLSSALGGYFILEVKFNDHFPTWLNPIISNFSLRKQSASKYVISMDSSRVIKNLSKSSLYTRSNFPSF
jgi:hypothetical protein